MIRHNFNGTPEFVAAMPEINEAFSNRLCNLPGCNNKVTSKPPSIRFKSPAAIDVGFCSYSCMAKALIAWKLPMRVVDKREKRLLDNLAKAVLRNIGRNLAMDSGRVDLTCHLDYCNKRHDYEHSLLLIITLFNTELALEFIFCSETHLRAAFIEFGLGSYPE